VKQNNIVVIGIDLGGSAIRLSTVAGNGKLRYSKRVDISGRRERKYILSSIITNITELIATEESHGTEVVAVGIGSPGIIDLNNVSRSFNKLFSFSPIFMAQVVCFEKTEHKPFFTLLLFTKLLIFSVMSINSSGLSVLISMLQNCAPIMSF